MLRSNPLKQLQKFHQEKITTKSDETKSEEKFGFYAYSSVLIVKIFGLTFMGCTFLVSFQWPKLSRKFWTSLYLNFFGNYFFGLFSALCWTLEDNCTQNGSNKGNNAFY
jgi:hypothetical protein